MNLVDFRSQLDEIDSQIVRLLGERFALCRQVAAFKRVNAIPMMQPQRVEQVISKYLALARKHEVDGEFARHVCEAIIAEACRIETVAMTDGSHDERASRGEKL